MAFFPIAILFIVCFLTLGFFIKRQSPAIDYWLFLGSIPSVLQNSNRLPEWGTEVFRSIGKGSCFFDGPIFTKLRYLATCDPQNIEYILKTNFVNFPKGENFREIFDILGDGIFNVDSDLWRVRRRMAHSCFTLSELKTLAAKTSRKVVVEQLVPFLAHATENEFTVDLQDVCSRVAFDINTCVIFGRYEKYLSLELPSHELAVAVDDAQDAILYRNAMPIFLWKFLRFSGIGKERKLARAHKKIDELFEEYICQKRKDLFAGVKTDDLLSTYIKALQDETSVVSSSANKDIFLRDEMLNLFIAGRDTITAGLIWFFWLVSKTPSVETKILDELSFVFSLKNKGEEAMRNHNWPWVFDSDDLKGLVYLHAALCESLRLYPPLPLNRKSVVKKDVLPDGTLVTPGMEIILSFYSAGRMPWIWGEDCLEFKPERWIDGNGKISFEATSKFFPFNIGPRTCLGKDISFTQMKSVVAAVLFNFRIGVVEGHHVCPKPFINLHMKNGLKVNIKKRTM
ncbi:hypothetical protein C5167_017742 [Papaver somniferum]|uniref:Cytochrome P450 n=1 Tax=Papaver somniferum TaxID=3469 RepID=A0A4Y7IMH3_PAPSO|nr:alkane hydroxylase MAH1-like [Papaver somniferum]RZC49316.1 hypothetical protein C5167_017742 [Papaver somniferum]